MAYRPYSIPYKTTLIRIIIIWPISLILQSSSSLLGWYFFLTYKRYRCLILQSTLLLLIIDIDVEYWILQTK